MGVKGASVLAARGASNVNYASQLVVGDCNGGIQGNGESANFLGLFVDARKFKASSSMGAMFRHVNGDKNGGLGTNFFRSLRRLLRDSQLVFRGGKWLLGNRVCCRLGYFSGVFRARNLTFALKGTTSKRGFRAKDGRCLVLRLAYGLADRDLRTSMIVNGGLARFRFGNRLVVKVNHFRHGGMVASRFLRLRRGNFGLGKRSIRALRSCRIVATALRTIRAGVVTSA